MSIQNPSLQGIRGIRALRSKENQEAKGEINDNFLGAKICLHQLKTSIPFCVGFRIHALKQDETESSIVKGGGAKKTNQTKKTPYPLQNSSKRLYVHLSTRDVFLVHACEDSQIFVYDEILFMFKDSSPHLCNFYHNVSSKYTGWNIVILITDDSRPKDYLQHCNL